MTEQQPPTDTPPESLFDLDEAAYARALKNLLARNGMDTDEAGLRGDDRTQRWGVALKAIPGFMAALKRVPRGYWTEEFEEGGTVHLARVRCTCGAEVLVEEGGKRDCDGEECERIFIYLGRDKLYVANSPVDRDAS